MSKIRIKNFGPIKDGFRDEQGNEWIEVKKVTAFIGNQGSGKSTVAKLISSFIWLEKALNRGDITISTGNDIRNVIAWHGLDSYYGEKFEIEYLGDCYKISYTHRQAWPIIENIEGGNYIVPKIMYISDQRNFLSTVKVAFDVTGLPGSLGSLAQKFKKAQIESNGDEVYLPLPGFAYKYDAPTDMSYVVGKDHKTNLLVASSGFQSVIPLFLVSRNLSMQVETEKSPAVAPVSANQSIRRDREISGIMQDSSLSIEEKSKKTDAIFAKYHNKCFINIVEEPEQNLFPESQKMILESLSGFNHNEGNRLIFTTHSPYIINFLSIAIQGQYLLDKINVGNRGDLIERLEGVIPTKSCIAAKDVVIYELDKAGNIIQLRDYSGIPSDKNYLNNSLAECNQLFDSLLEIEEDL